MYTARDLYSEILIGTDKTWWWPWMAETCCSDIDFQEYTSFISYELCYWPPSHISNLHTQQGWHSLRLWFDQLAKTTFYSTKFQLGRRIPWFTQPRLHNRLKIPPTNYRTLHHTIDDWLLICDKQNSSFRCHRGQVVIRAENGHHLWLTDERFGVLLICDKQNSASRCHWGQVVIRAENGHHLWLTDERFGVSSSWVYYWSMLLIKCNVIPCWKPTKETYLVQQVQQNE